MKLRLHRNSIRLRLSPADVERLQKTGLAAEVTRIAPGIEFSYCIRAAENISKPRAVLDAHQLRLELPATLARDWAQSEQVCLRGSQDAGDGETLEIVVEKDFECLESAQVSDEVFYPHPGKTCR